jgi:hypothetical protein
MTPTTATAPAEFTPVRHVENRYPGQGVTVGRPYRHDRRTYVDVQWPGQGMARRELVAHLVTVTR